MSYPKYMKAAILHGPMNIKIEEKWPIPRIRSDEVLVKCKACGICGTDIHMWTGALPRNYPLIMGHEFVGEVVAVGDKVASLQEGDRVTAECNITCGVCRACRRGISTTLCENIKFWGHQVDGAFAEYTVIPEKITYKVPDNVSDDIACLTEPLACVYHGNDVADIKRGDTVVVIGAGPIGNLHIIMAKEAGASKVISIEPAESRREYAKMSGADVIVNPMVEDPIKRVMEETENRGAEVIIECAGLPKTQEQGVEMLAKGARLIIFGITSEDAYMRFKTQKFLFEEKKIIAAASASYTFDHTLKVLSSGKLNDKLRGLITHRLPLDEIEKGLNIIAKKLNGSMKVLIQCESI